MKNRTKRSTVTTSTRPAVPVEVTVEPNHVPHDPDSTTAWMADGSCRLHPPATFFPSDGVGVDRARKICASCPVIGTCLEFALDERIDHGVWGGCSERERRRILKSRRIDVVDASVSVTDVTNWAL